MREFNANLEERQKAERKAILDAREKKRADAKAAAKQQRAAAFDAAVAAEAAQSNASHNQSIFQCLGRPCLKKHRQKKATCFMAFDLMLDEPSCILVESRYHSSDGRSICTH